MTNGCHNRKPYAAETTVQDGWHEIADGKNVTRIPRMVTVPHRMSTDCQFSRDPMGYGQQDEGCVGCKWRA